MQEITTVAKVENLDMILNLIESALKKSGCDETVQSKIETAVEEIFVNVAKYAYSGKTGEITVIFDVENDEREFYIEFRDRGIEFNPLSREDPDVKLPVKDRKIGGLGIFIVKKTMDYISYDFVDGMNVLKMRKKL